MKTVKFRIVCPSGIGSDTTTQVQLLDPETDQPIRDSVTGEELDLPVTHVYYDLPAFGPTTAVLTVIMAKTDVVSFMTLPDGTIERLKDHGIHLG